MIIEKRLTFTVDPSKDIDYFAREYDQFNPQLRRFTWRRVTRDPYLAELSLVMPEARGNQLDIARITTMRAKTSMNLRIPSLLEALAFDAAYPEEQFRSVIFVPEICALGLSGERSLACCNRVIEGRIAESWEYATRSNLPPFTRFAFMSPSDVDIGLGDFEARITKLLS